MTSSPRQSKPMMGTHCLSSSAVMCRVTPFTGTTFKYADFLASLTHLSAKLAVPLLSLSSSVCAEVTLTPSLISSPVLFLTWVESTKLKTCLAAANSDELQSSVRLTSMQYS